MKPASPSPSPSPCPPSPAPSPATMMPDLPRSNLSDGRKDDFKSNNVGKNDHTPHNIADATRRSKRLQNEQVRRGLSQQPNPKLVPFRLATPENMQFDDGLEEQMMANITSSNNSFHSDQAASSIALRNLVPEGALHGPQFDDDSDL